MGFNTNLNKWIGHQFLCRRHLKIQFFHYHIHSVTQLFSSATLIPDLISTAIKMITMSSVVRGHTDLICEKKRALVSDWYSVWAATLRSGLVFREKSLCSCSQSLSQGFTQMSRYDVKNHFERIILPWHVLHCMSTLHWNMHKMDWWCLCIVCHCSYFVSMALSLNSPVNTIISYPVDVWNLGILPVHKGVPHITAHPGWTVPDGQWVTQYWHSQRARRELKRRGWKKNESVRCQRWGLKGLDDNRPCAPQCLQCVSSAHPCCSLMFRHDTRGVWTAARIYWKTRSSSLPLQTHGCWTSFKCHLHVDVIHSFTLVVFICHCRQILINLKMLRHMFGFTQLYNPGFRARQ